MSYLIFDGVNLTERFGLVISGSGTFNGPARAVEGIAVPGRNGYLIRDDGRYENIELIYAGSGLKKKDVGNLADLRAFLSVRQGAYFKLADSYHPDEYRMARFVGPLEAAMSPALRMASFDLAFDCKPQRFLLNGDEAKTFAVGSASSYTYHTADEMSSIIAGVVESAAFAAGYSRSEIASLRYSILPVDFTAIYTALGGEDAILNFRLGWDQPYFWVACDANPLTATGFISTSGYSRSALASNMTAYSYLIQPYGFNAGVLLNGTVKAEDGLATAYVLVNPEQVLSKPLLKLHVNYAEPLSNYIAGVNGCGIFFDGTIRADIITIDTETLNAYSLPEDNPDGTLLNVNHDISFSEDAITLEPGINMIYTTASASVDVVPRWVRL